MNMTAAMEARTNKPLTACTDQEIYLALLDIVREQSAARVRPVTGRKLCSALIADTVTATFFAIIIAPLNQNCSFHS